MSKDALDGWRVDGKITATEQATQPGDVPILDSTGKIPDELINAVEVDDFYTESTDDDAVTMDENKVWRLNGWEGLGERVGDAEDDIDGLSTRMETALNGKADKTAVNSELALKADKTEVALKADKTEVTAHTERKDNPHNVTKAQVGLGAYPTSPADIGISTATQAALNGKADKTEEKAVVTVTVTPMAVASGLLVKAIGNTTVAAYTNASGVATLELDGGEYLVSVVAPAGYITPTSQSLTVVKGVDSSMRFALKAKFKFSMTLNATTMQTDPTGCFAYSDDASGMIPLANTNTSLAAVPMSDRGSWNKGTNPLLKKLYYATFNTDGSISKILDPDNLALDEDGNASDIETKNTMLVIPTLYTKGESGKITISTDPAEGTAHAHTIDGHVYDNLAIGVYNGYVSGSRLMSLSGVLPTKNQTRATFRTQANANGTNWMLWNYWHWKLLKEMTFFTLKSFDGQRKLGRGGHYYASNTTGVTNGMGMFAGDISGTSSAMKCYIEDWWGTQYQYIDDFYGTGGTYYAGKNAIPTDNTANKVQVFNNLTDGWWYGNTINQTDVGWAIASASGGSNATGLCDGQYGATSSDRLGSVGGTSGDVTNEYAGPSCLRASYDLSYSEKYFGARLAFVFDE